MGFDPALFTPLKLADMIGNGAAIARMLEYGRDVNCGKPRKPLMLFGPPGTGKTTAVQLLAKELNWNVVELNASDYRDSETIMNRIVPATRSRNIYGKMNAIVMDEIDELAGRFDGGAGSSITELIKGSRSPIIFVANDPWDRRINFLRNVTENVEFKKVDTARIEALLKRAADEHGMVISLETLHAVAQKSDGDVRSALNDLFVFVGSDGSESIVQCIGQRDVSVDIFKTLDRIFFSNTLTGPLIAAMNSDVENDMLIRWIEENVSKRYKRGGDLGRAFGSLSEATLFSARASKLQYYGLWRYMNVHMSSGVALAKSEYPSNVERYTFPKIVSTLSKAKPQKERLQSISQKLKGNSHGNTKATMAGTLKLLGEMARQGARDSGKPAVYEFFESRYGITNPEVDAITEL